MSKTATKAAKLIHPHTGRLGKQSAKTHRKTVRIVIDEYLQTVIDSRKAYNAMLADADVVKILLGEKVTDELRSQQKQAGQELLDLIKQVPAPQSFLNKTAQEQEEYIENIFAND
jgi:urease accessory protein UreF